MSILFDIVEVDDKQVRVYDEIRFGAKVTPEDGISGDSDLEIVVTQEGLIVDLVEITERSAPSAEVTRTFSITFEELKELLK